MGSFPQMLSFKNKKIPNTQLLRWSNWFSQFSFTVTHIKGKSNIVADFFSRHPRDTFQIQPSIRMYSSIIPSFANPPEVFDLSQPWEKEVLENARRNHEISVFANYGKSILNLFCINPEYPFSQIFVVQTFFFPEPLLWVFWYLCNSYHILIEFQSSLFIDFERLAPNLQFLLKCSRPKLGG